MPVFTYRGTNRSGGNVSGELTATSKAELQNLLRRQQITPTKMSEKGNIRDNNGAEVKQVTMREPRAGDINRYGNPVRVNTDGEILIEERKMTYMIAALTGILVPFIEDMDTRDWNSCAYRIRGFFLPELAAW